MIWSHRQQKLANRKRQRGNSALQIKSLLTYQIVHLRSTTGDSRLNHLMMLYVHKDRTDALTPVDVANDFVGRKKTKAIVCQIFRERYPKQLIYFIKVNTNGKQNVLQTNVVMYQKVRFNQGTEAGGEGGGRLMWATRSAPPSHFMLATGLVSEIHEEGDEVRIGSFNR